jgi:SAM-dependent methyltransferase
MPRGEEARGDPGSGRWFEAVADHAGLAYLRYSFTKGTEQEVRFLAGELALAPGDTLLDVGCGPGRHTMAFARIGVRAVGVDISEKFLRIASRAGGPCFARGDARCLPVPDDSVDAVVSLCQGGFGLVGLESSVNAPGGTGDGAVLAELARVLRPGGHLVLSAFSSYFVVRNLEESDLFDPATAVNHEIAEVRDESGRVGRFDLWTTCFTPRELRLLAQQVGLTVDGLWSVSPGDYARRPPDTEHPEWLLVAAKPHGHSRVGDR